jgi:hypothetical protein
MLLKEIGTNGMHYKDMLLIIFRTLKKINYISRHLPVFKIYLG